MVQAQLSRVTTPEITSSTNISSARISGRGLRGRLLSNTLEIRQVAKAIMEEEGITEVAIIEVVMEEVAMAEEVAIIVVVPIPEIILVPIMNPITAEPLQKEREVVSKMKAEGLIMEANKESPGIKVGTILSHISEGSLTRTSCFLRI